MRVRSAAVNEESARAVIEAIIDQKDKPVESGLLAETKVTFVIESERAEGTALTGRQVRSIFETRTITAPRPVPVDAVAKTSRQFALFDQMLDTVDLPLSRNLVEGFFRALGAEHETTGDAARLIETILSSYAESAPGSPSGIACILASFDGIRPFREDAGRVGRAVAFRECLSNGCMPFIVPGELPADIFASNDACLLVERLQTSYLETYAGLVPKHHVVPAIAACAAKARPDISSDAELFFLSQQTRPSAD